MQWGDTPSNSPVKGAAKLLPPFPDKIIPGLYISNIVTAEAIIRGEMNLPNKPVFTHVLSLFSGKREDIDRLRPPPESTLHTKHILIGDHPKVDIVEWFPDICRMIHEALKEPTNNVLVHCYAGISRSVTAITAYLIWALHLSCDDALTYMAAMRKGARPNPGFNLQLQLWEEVDCNLVDEEESAAGFFAEKEEYSIGKEQEGWVSGTRSGEACIGALLEIERPNPQVEK